MPRKSIPLPWWLITDAPTLRTATLSVRRSVTCLAMAYWAGRCAAMPEDHASVAALACVPAQTWAVSRDRVLAAFAPIRAALDAAHAEAAARQQRDAQRAVALTAARLAKRAERERARSSGQVATPVLTQPRRDPPPSRNPLTVPAPPPAAAPSPAARPSPWRPNGSRAPAPAPTGSGSTFRD